MHYAGKEPLVHRTLGQQLDITVETYGNREAIVSRDEGRRLTFNALRDQVDRLAAGFLKIGLERGDRVGIWAPNYLHWYLTMLAASRSGLVSVGINPAFQGPEVLYCLNKVGIRALVAPETFKSQNYYNILETVDLNLKSFDAGQIKSEKFPSLRSLIIDSKDKHSGAFRFDDLLGMSSDVESVQRNMSTIQPDFPCNIQFTSGTTGSPKAAVLTHNNIVNNGLTCGKRNEYENQIVCNQNPLFHVFGVIISIMGCISKGATLVLPTAGYSPEQTLKTIVEEKCTVIHGTPTMYVDLIKKQQELKLPMDTVQYAVTGGAPCSPTLYTAIKKVFGLRKVKTIYGLTETTCCIFQSLPEESEEHMKTTVGHLHDHVEVKIVDDNGNMVPFGERGELMVRGYCNMYEYFGDEEKTNEVKQKDGWLKTGDQFVLREDGYGVIVGRLKEMVIRGGENIFPKEIEDFLSLHPDIVETNVIGVPDERMGEELCAFVRLKDGSSLDSESLKKYCKGKIAHFKVPKHIRVVDAFPKTASGKVQKFKLREIYDKS